jgi:hypothetical protein
MLQVPAGVAQLAEQPSCKRQVSGSNPLTGSRKSGTCLHCSRKSIRYMREAQGPNQFCSYAMPDGRRLARDGARRSVPALRRGPWRRRLGGFVIVGASYALPVILPQITDERWHWFGSVWFDFGEPLSLLPGVILIALLAPLVSYRRRDALTMLVPPYGIRVAWRAGTRLAQLPRRDWPALSDEIMLSGRWAGQIAAALGKYETWRQPRIKPAGQVATPADVDRPDPAQLGITSNVSGSGP